MNDIRDIKIRSGRFRLRFDLRSISFLWVALLTFTFASCKKGLTVIPGGKEDIALNFYPASDVLNAAYSLTQSTIAVYVDKYIQQKGPLFSGTGHAFATFSFGFVGYNEYPNTLANNGTNYVRYNAGSHKIMFTDTTNAIIADTTINPAAKSYTCLYIADAPAAANAPAVYKVIAVNEDRNVPANKVGIKFIHLSPDAGDLTISLQKADGSLTGILPNTLKYPQASAYQYFDASAVISGLLRFTLANPANGATVIKGVPYNPGRSYVLVISGFLNDTQRQMPTGKNPDGSVKYATVSISKNLRADVRTSY